MAAKLRKMYLSFVPLRSSPFSKQLSKEFLCATRAMFFREFAIRRENKTRREKKLDRNKKQKQKRLKREKMTSKRKKSFSAVWSGQVVEGQVGDEQVGETQVGEV